MEYLLFIFDFSVWILSSLLKLFFKKMTMDDESIDLDLYIDSLNL